MKSVKQLIREAEELLGKQSEEQKQNILRQLRGTAAVLGPVLEGDSISIWQYDDHGYWGRDEREVDAWESEVIENNHLFLEKILDLLTPPTEAVRGSITFGSLNLHGIYEFKIIPKGVVADDPDVGPMCVPLSDIALDPTPDGIRWSLDTADVREDIPSSGGMVTSGAVCGDIRFRVAAPRLGSSFKVEMSEPSLNAVESVRSRALRETRAPVREHGRRAPGDQTFHAAFTQSAVSRLRNHILRDVLGYPPWDY